MMTDPVVDLGETLPVIGQRQRPDGTFPTRGGSGREPDQLEVSSDPNPQPPNAFDPCVDSALALEWNADAAAAEAAKEFTRRAADQGEDLNDRE